MWRRVALIREATPRHIPEDDIFHNHRREHLKFHIIWKASLQSRVVGLRHEVHY
jgi:hypothetical protein